MRRSKLRNKRPKALFGEVAAAGIQAAATLAAAGIQARQMASSAKEQANAQIQGAQMQAKSIEQTNQNNNTLQQQSQQFIASENEANRQLQRDWQMNMQLAQGMLTSEDRRAESRIQVKKGGKVRRSSKGLRDASFPLRAGNLPFQVTDGGGVLYEGATPEGFDLYEIVGHDHEHYHKTGGNKDRKIYAKGGKYKSGVGIKFGNGQVVEGEGNQNTGQGEYLLVTPDAGYFISKHSINGFNPAQAINAGMHPLQAYQLQEANKNGSSPVGRMYAKGGLYVQPVLATGYPVQDLNFDMVGPNSAYLMQRPALKRGGRVKAKLGYNGYQLGKPGWWGWTATGGGGNGPYFSEVFPSYIDSNIPDWLKAHSRVPAINFGNINYSSSQSTNPSGQIIKTSGSKSFRDRLRGISGNLWGAGLTTLGNLGGAWLTSWGANRASKYLSKAYTDSADILANAYDRLQGVDMNSLKREDFAGAHYMPVVQSVYQNVNPQLENTNREFRRLMRATNAGTLSTAARLSRQYGANSAAAEQRSAIYADQANREAQARLQDTQMINEAAAKNAELDVQSSRDFTSHYVDLLKYNADIANERITGRAQAIADGMLGAAGARATAAQTSGQSWGNALANSGQAFGNALATDAKYRAELEMARIGASRRGELSYLKRLGSTDEINAEVNRLYSMLNNPNLSEQAKNEIQTELAYLTSDLYENSRNINNFNISMSKLGRMRGLATR